MKYVDHNKKKSVLQDALAERRLEDSVEHKSDSRHPSESCEKLQNKSEGKTVECNA